MGRARLRSVHDSTTSAVPLGLVHQRLMAAHNSSAMMYRRVLASPGVDATDRPLTRYPGSGNDVSGASQPVRRPPAGRRGTGATQTTVMHGPVRTPGR
jgi:hypothetical protein